jgi:CheY-like chemotaxis protein
LRSRAVRDGAAGACAYFALLVVVFAVTSAAATAYVVIQSNRDGRRDAQRDARSRPRRQRASSADRSRNLHASVKGVAATPDIEQALKGTGACALQFPPVGGLETGHVEMLRADGTVACSSRPAKGNAPPRGYERAPWLRQTAAGPLFSAPIADTAAGGHAALVTSPIRAGIVAAILALEPAGPSLARLYGGGRPVELVVTTRDRRTVIARSIDSRGSIGSSIKDTGLGLATVYGIVRQSGGFLWAYSEPGRGSSFKVYLPVADVAIRARAATPPSASLSAAGHTVRLVEDDEAVRATVRRMLDTQGFEIVEAARGEEALAVSEAEDPDSLTLLVTDTIVPGPGGIELADRVRQRHPALRTLIMSGYTEPPTSGASDRRRSSSPSRSAPPSSRPSSPRCSRGEGTVT